MTATIARSPTVSLLLAVQGLLIFVPLVVLGATIGWPASGAAVAAVLAAPLVSLLGIDPGQLTTVATTAVQLWFLAAAVTLFRTPLSQPGDRP